MERLPAPGGVAQPGGKRLLYAHLTRRCKHLLTNNESHAQSDWGIIAEPHNLFTGGIAKIPQGVAGIVIDQISLFGGKTFAMRTVSTSRVHRPGFSP